MHLAMQRPAAISTRRPPQQRVQVWTVVLVLAAMTRLITAAPIPDRASGDASKSKEPPVPTFMADLYECWNSNGVCPDGLDVTQETVDRARSFVGIRKL